MSEYEVVGYRCDMWDVRQWDKYCDNHDPLTFNEWYKLTIDWMNGKTNRYPYVGCLDER